MSPVQFEVMTTLFRSGFKPVIWGSDATSWRIGPVYRVSIQTKRALERQGWIELERSRMQEGFAIDWFRVTDEGRRAFIAVGGNPGQVGHTRKKGRR